MSLILSLETSSEVCSVCLHEDEKILKIVESTEAFSHTRKITLFIASCFEGTGKRIEDLSAIAVSQGPGSYTGLRVGASTAKGMCYGLDIPLISVSTLLAIADNASMAYPGKVYIPLIDARRMEVYTSIFDENLEVLKETNNLILAIGVFEKEFAGRTASLVLCGTGINKAVEFFEEDYYIIYPFSLSASHMVRIADEKFRNGQFENLVAFEPNYFKAPNVTKSKKALF